MVHLYLPAAYYHLNLDVTKENLLAAGFSAVPAVFLVGFQFQLVHWIDLRAGKLVSLCPTKMMILFTVVTSLVFYQSYTKLGSS